MKKEDLLLFIKNHARKKINIRFEIVKDREVIIIFRKDGSEIIAFPYRTLAGIIPKEEFYIDSEEDMLCFGILFGIYMSLEESEMFGITNPRKSIILS